jgi:TolB protein
MKYLLHLSLLVLSVSFVTAQPLGEFNGFTHVGSTDKKGTTQYNEVDQEYTIEGASGNMWFDRDDFHFLWKKMKGDFILTAQVEFLSTGVDPHRKVGWMVRHSLEANSPQLNGVVHGDGLTSIQYRRSPGGQTEEVKSERQSPDVIQLERRGSTYALSVARFGEPFSITRLEELALGDEVYIGLFLCSHNEQAVEKAVFRNVRVVVPAPDSLVPYRQYIGSHLELMDVEKGRRKIIYTDKGSIQAPNWTVDGKSLIYNKEGGLYRFDLQTSQHTKIDAGFADRNNNDHVLSFDGKMLGISHHSAEDKGVSMVYVMPTTGGIPVKVTTLGPSYFHGWSPDGKWLTYTGGRNNEYDIYKIPVKGGKEINLTNNQGLDDGPEYSPDGKYIYFNSVRSGLMQLWRMKPDGSKPEQLTSDEFNNWFPHISPDGKWIAFLSFGQDVAPGDHPFYKRVMIRIMPAQGGPPRTLAYLYGGQGTINVPSWSPDSKRIAFVSNLKQD